MTLVLVFDSLKVLLEGSKLPRLALPSRGFPRSTQHPVTCPKEHGICWHLESVVNLMGMVHKGATSLGEIRLQEPVLARREVRRTTTS